MPSFEDLFWKSDGAPVAYKGRTLLMLHHLKTETKTCLRVTRESTSSKWQQGVCLRCSLPMRVDGVVAEELVLWEDSSPPEVCVTLTPGTSEVRVFNVWDSGLGFADSWHNGAAMAIERLEDGFRYRCNDGVPDDDFDDIVFRISLVEGSCGSVSDSKSVDYEERDTSSYVPRLLVMLFLIGVLIPLLDGLLDVLAELFRK